MLHQLASGSWPRLVGQKFGGVGAVTVVEYAKEVVNILSNQDKLLPQFVSLPSGDRLKDIIDGFEDITCLPNIVGVIDGSSHQTHGKTL